MRSLGLTVPLAGMPLLEHRDLVRALPDLGYTDLWTAEVAGADAFTPLALAAVWEPSLRLGTAIVPVFTRGPALIAMSAATLAAAAPGRFVLGLGASSPTIVSEWNGLDFDRPYRRTRDVLRFVRRALSGERVDASLDTFAVHRFRLENPPATPVPVMLAALRPQMLRLAGREADGAILNWLAPEDVARCLEAIGNPGGEVVARIFVCPTGDRDHARRVARMMIAAYLTVPAYAAFHDWLGRGDRLRPMQEAWRSGDRKAAVAALPDDLVDELVVHGSPDECRDRINAYIEAGIGTPVLALLPTPEVPSAELLGEVLRRIGQDS